MIRKYIQDQEKHNRSGWTPFEALIIPQRCEPVEYYPSDGRKARDDTLDGFTYSTKLNSIKRFDTVRAPATRIDAISSKSTRLALAGLLEFFNRSVSNGNQCAVYSNEDGLLAQVVFVMTQKLVPGGSFSPITNRALLRPQEESS